jgi:hypothetical protein
MLGEGEPVSYEKESIQMLANLKATSFERAQAMAPQYL